MPHAIYGNTGCDTTPSAPQNMTIPADYTNQITTILQQLNATKNKNTAINRLTLIVEELVIRQARAVAVKPVTG